ncbi:MAG: NADH:flavin oxidoreductase/NADH oxidase [Sulfuriferula sp.]|nr:NADH:flavin oxidoreductase/NADH oxidase [Sulfuriferula sp.]
MSQLFSPIDIGKQTLSNRIVISPMCQYSAEQGQATDWHLIHLGHMALSGAGLLFIEATAVTAQGRISAGDLGLWSDQTEAALARVIKGIRQYSAIPIAIQLAHAGRKASTQVPWDGGKFVPTQQGGWQTVAPSALPYSADDAQPLALDKADLQRISYDFAAAAQRAHRLGLDVIELHAAHGYLLHEFLSPLSNVRNDEYGGSLENRMRFPLQVFEAIQSALPDGKPVGIRISATDWVPGGWDIEQSVVFAKALQQRGCAFIDVSSGGLSPLQQIPLEPGYQVPFAARIRQETGLPTIAVGLITEPLQAETIITSGQADMVALARGMLYDPRWPWHAAAQLGAQTDAPKQYWRSQPRTLKTLFKQ